jgi:hypothetical protein
LATNGFKTRKQITKLIVENEKKESILDKEYFDKLADTDAR